MILIINNIHIYIKINFSTLDVFIIISFILFICKINNIKMIKVNKYHMYKKIDTCKNQWFILVNNSAIQYNKNNNTKIEIGSFILVKFNSLFLLIIQIFINESKKVNIKK